MRYQRIFSTLLSFSFTLTTVSPSYLSALRVPDQKELQYLNLEETLTKNTITDISELLPNSPKALKIRADFGGKALGLFRLQTISKEYNFNVPEFELIGIDFFDSFLKYNNIERNEIKKIYQNSKKEMEDIYQEIKYIFSQVNFSKEQEKNLRDIFSKVAQKGKPIAIRGSSEFEDGEKHQFKGIYATEFLIFSKNIEEDFQSFLYKIKMVYASMFSPNARSYRLANGIPDRDRMGIVIQQVVGSWQNYSYYPPFSGVTLFLPYNPRTTISDINFGLNTKTVAGKYRWRTATISTPSGFYTSITKPSVASNAYIDFERLETLVGMGKVSSEIIPNNFLENENIKYLESVSKTISKIARALKDKLGPVELEWSIDDEGIINIYQCRPSFALERLTTQPIEIRAMPKENIIAESEIVSGHGKIIAPLVIIKETKNKLYADFMSKIEEIGREKAKKLNRDGYILVGNLDKMLENWISPSQGSLNYIFPNLIGLINISAEPIPLAAHWSEFFIQNNILVISTKDINEKLIAKVSKETTKTSLKVSEIPVTMAVNTLEGRGQVFVEKLPESKPEPVKVTDKAKVKFGGKGATAEETTPGIRKPQKTRFFSLLVLLVVVYAQTKTIKKTLVVEKCFMPLKIKFVRKILQAI